MHNAEVGNVCISQPGDNLHVINILVAIHLKESQLFAKWAVFMTLLDQKETM